MLLKLVYLSETIPFVKSPETYSPLELASSPPLLLQFFNSNPLNILVASKII